MKTTSPEDGQFLDTIANRKQEGEEMTPFPKYVKNKITGVPCRNTQSIHQPPYLIWSYYGIFLWDFDVTSSHLRDIMGNYGKFMG